MTDLLCWILFFLAISFLDALRDTLRGKVKGWWKWHLIKWGSFYPPLALLLWMEVVFERSWGSLFAIGIIILSTAAWKAGAVAGGKGDWGGFWLKILRRK